MSGLWPEMPQPGLARSNVRLVYICLALAQPGHERTHLLGVTNHQNHVKYGPTQDGLCLRMC